MESDKAGASKPYQITFEFRPEYLYVYVTGEHDSYEISKQYWQEVADFCGENKISKVLIEEDIPESVSLTEVYRLASEIPMMGFFGIRVAFVDRFIEHNELNQFGELVAVNRGLHGKIFNDIKEAEKWLLAE